MWTTVLDALTTAAAWPWLAPLTTLAQATTAAITLATAVHRARRSTADDRYRDDR